MKYVFIILFGCFAVGLNAQKSTNVKLEMSPYDFTSTEVNFYKKWLKSDQWFDTDQKIYKANSSNVYMLGYGRYLVSGVSVPKKLANRLQSNKLLFAFIEGDQCAVYHKEKGMMRTVKGIRVLSGDK